jgi:diguanylate cyclase (GGDEF)-like protein
VSNPAILSSIGTTSARSTPALEVLHDATFFHAIVPYAVSQARRHGEPIALLCLSVDWLGGIHELLGPDKADEAVQRTGFQIATMIRESDLVARMDDDRIIVLLPRSTVDDALHVARKISRSIEQNRLILPELPGLTVSLGVASYPDCAETVYALLDAADEALSLAKKHGRNQVVAARLLPEASPVSRSFGPAAGAHRG